LCGKCDAVLLVTRAGTTTRQAVKSSLELVEGINARVTGVVLNDVDLKGQSGQAYYRSYSY
jgi:Mrp family chromosome partitioning ATPase